MIFPATSRSIINGSFTIDFSGDEPVYTPVEAADSCKLIAETAFETAAKAIVWMGIRPFTAPVGTELEIIFRGSDADGKEFSQTKTITLDKDWVFSAGRIKHLAFLIDDPVYPVYSFVKTDTIEPGLKYIMVVQDGEMTAEPTKGKAKNKPFIHLCSRFHSLDQVLMRMLKESDNLYAESVLYQIAASGGVKNASAKDARQWINKLITRIGLNPGEYKFADGSGLSLYNYVSAELLVRLLRFAYHNQNIYGQLYPALPIAGVDGTLEKRMKGAHTNGNVRAKTGTLTGISSLAGYCTAANGHKLALAIINQGVLRNASGRTFQDKVCTALCEP